MLKTATYRLIPPFCSGSLIRQLVKSLEILSMEYRPHLRQTRLQASTQIKKVFLGGETLFLVLLALSSCQNLPISTRSGDVLDVSISDRLTTSTIEVNVGDEIRWTNSTVEPVHIVFYDRILEHLSCRRNFDGYYTGGAEAILRPNQSASLCFRDPGTIQYALEGPPSGPPPGLSRQIRIMSSTSQR